MAVLIIAALVVLAVGALLLFRRGSTPTMPSGWTAITDGNDYGCKVDAGGSFTFPQSPSSVHYVTEACGPLAGKTQLRLRYQIDADPGVTFHDAQNGNPIATGPMLYFQRAGDDWSGLGAFETYRWWALASAGSLAPGEHEIVAKFSDVWNAVMTSHSDTSPQAFADALANAARAGFTFPNDSGAGHGIYASGKATFTLVEFATE